MSKKVCVVTGSSSGIGAATVRLFAKNGWNVAVNFSREAGPAEQVAADCRALGADVAVLRANVAEDEDCRRLAREVESRWGQCDALVNNAGTTKFVPVKSLEGLTAEDFQRIYSVNTIGAFQVTRAFAPLMARRSGAAIVNVSSMAAVTGVGSSIAYMASKGALNTLTLALARALGPAIRVNAVAPGFVDTLWLLQGLGAERHAAAKAAFMARAALDAVIAPEDVAETIYFLAAAAVKTTGEVILIDAGFKLGRA
jgi:3-oxoacyl-[acyl-carrier protein] reductase